MNGQQSPQYPEVPGQAYPSSPPPPLPPPPQFPGQPGPFSPLPQSLPPRTTNRKPQILIAGALVALLITAGVFSYFWYFIPPEKVVQAMVKKTVETESLEYTGQVDLETADIIPFLTGKLSIGFNGTSDLRDSDNPKESFNLNMGKTQVEMIGVGDIAYLKVNNLPNLLTDFLGDSGKIENQWVKIDPEEVGTEFGLEEEVKAAKDEELTAEEEEKIKEAFLGSKLFKVIEKLPAEKVGKVRTHHYKFVVDKDNLIKLLEKIVKITGDEPLTADEIKSTKEELEIGGELWIGKKDFQLYKVVLDVKLKDKEEPELLATLRLSTQFKNHNQPVKIDIPSSAKPLSEVLDELGGEDILDFGGFGDVGNFKDSDRDGLSDDEESVYGANVNNPDTDGDGYKDGEEVDSGFNPTGSGKLF